MLMRTAESCKCRLSDLLASPAEPAGSSPGMVKAGGDGSEQVTCSGFRYLFYAKPEETQKD